MLVLDIPIEGTSFGFDLGFGMSLTTMSAHVGSSMMSRSTDVALNNLRSLQQSESNPLPLPLNSSVMHLLLLTQQITHNYNYVWSKASTSIC